MSPRTPDRSRLLRIAFLAILVFSAAQVVWWMIDQRRLVELETERLERAQVSAEELAAVAGEHTHRLRQYAWEGGFFLLVLAACVAVIARTLREESQLRRRQQNFIASVTHELKSPLASLQLAAETIALRRPEGEKLERLVTRMRGDVRRLEGMVGKILDTASLEAGRLQLKKERLDLGRIADEIADEFADRARERGVEIVRTVPAALCVAADPAATRTIVRNLVDNALRATAAAGGGTITLAARAAGGEVELEVADTGVGFDPGEALRLFEKFYRPGDELRRTSRGTGLGLYVVRRFAELERGRVAAASEGPGRGARFVVAWPGCGEEAT
ncbi:MAG TPA: HAMP domain-containing sensor histidine kinase [Thermoanaerobaculia bacterium]|jgi:signal transduction histidine kinase